MNTGYDSIRGKSISGESRWIVVDGWAIGWAHGQDGWLSFEIESFCRGHRMEKRFSNWITGNSLWGDWFYRPKSML